MHVFLYTAVYQLSQLDERITEQEKERENQEEAHFMLERK
jgi:hypothetical protein